MGDRAKRRKLQENNLCKQNAVKEVYKTLHHKHGDKGVPHLLDFRRFPTTQLVQNTPGNVTSTDLHREPLLSMLEQDLERWRENARESLGAILGFPGWKDASKHKLHPVNRLTARFICKSCGKKEGREAAWDSVGLDFKEACQHRCVNPSRKQKDKVIFTPDNFEPDPKVCRSAICF